MISNSSWGWLEFEAIDVRVYWVATAVTGGTNTIQVGSGHVFRELALYESDEIAKIRYLNYSN